MNTINSSSPALQAYTASASAHAQNSAPPLCFKAIDEARAHVAQQKFPDRTQALLFLESIDGLVEENKVGKNSASLLKEALIEKVKSLDTLKIRTLTHAQDYLKLHYPTRDSLDELGNTLLFRPHDFAIDEETSRQLAQASKNYFNSLTAPRQFRSPVMPVLQNDLQTFGIIQAQSEVSNEVMNDALNAIRNQGLTVEQASHRFGIRDLLQLTQLRSDAIRLARPEVPREIMDDALNAIRNLGLTAEQASERFGIRNELQLTQLRSEAVRLARPEVSREIMDDALNAIRNQGLTVEQASHRFGIRDLLQQTQLRSDAVRLARPEVPREIMDDALNAIRNQGLTAEQASERFSIRDLMQDIELRRAARDD